MSVDAVVYFRRANATISIINVDDAASSTMLLAQVFSTFFMRAIQTTLRNVLGTKTLAEMLSQREVISYTMQTHLDDATDPWGVKVLSHNSPRENRWNVWK